MEALANPACCTQAQLIGFKLKLDLKLGLVVYAFNPSTQQAVILMSAWSA